MTFKPFLAIANGSAFHTLSQTTWNTFMSDEWYRVLKSATDKSKLDGTLT
jgi:hypothetical protein